MSSASTSWRVIVIEDDGAEALQQCLSQLAGALCGPPKTIVQFGGAGKEAGAGGQGAQDGAEGVSPAEATTVTAPMAETTSGAQSASGAKGAGAAAADALGGGEHQVAPGGPALAREAPGVADGRARVGGAGDGQGAGQENTSTATEPVGADYFDPGGGAGAAGFTGGELGVGTHTSRDSRGLQPSDTGEGRGHGQGHGKEQGPGERITRPDAQRHVGGVGGQRGLGRSSLQPGLSDACQLAAHRVPRAFWLLARRSRILLAASSVWTCEPACP